MSKILKPRFPHPFDEAVEELEDLVQRHKEKFVFSERGPVDREIKAEINKIFEKYGDRLAIIEENLVKLAYSPVEYDGNCPRRKAKLKLVN